MSSFSDPNRLPPPPAGVTLQRVTSPPTGGFQPPEKSNVPKILGYGCLGLIVAVMLVVALTGVGLYLSRNEGVLPPDVPQTVAGNQPVVSTVDTIMGSTEETLPFTWGTGPVITTSEVDADGTGIPTIEAPLIPEWPIGTGTPTTEAPLIPEWPIQPD